jgi:hypothetical protein
LRIVVNNYWAANINPCLVVIVRCAGCSRGEQWRGLAGWWRARLGAVILFAALNECKGVSLLVRKEGRYGKKLCNFPDETDNWLISGKLL